MGSKNLKAIDFFCSGGGMTYGLKKAGIDVIAGIDNDSDVQKTYETNNPDSKFILADVFDLKEKELQHKTEIDKDDDNLIFVGCSPCQYWTIINTDKTNSRDSKDLLKEFHRFVKFYNPGYVVVENVPGLELRQEESGLKEFVNDLKSRDYTVTYDVYNLNEYNVPQSRRRFSLIASRIIKEEIEPEKSSKMPKVKHYIGEEKGFYKVEAGFKDKTKFQHTVAGLQEKNLQVIKNTPKNGGNSIKKRESYRGSGFKDSYSRMSWDKPAPTITTRFYSFSNGRFGHPEEDRAISLREGATLQTFPKDYYFDAKSVSAIARMIGNAVPPEFARRIGQAIIKKAKKND